MKSSSTQESELIKILNKGGIWTTEEIANELGIEKRKVGRVVKGVRKRFLAGSTDVQYIFTTGIGYTLDEKPEHVAYESQMRLQQGYGVLMNGVYVFKQCKVIAPSIFNNLEIAFKPKMLTVSKLIKK